MRSTTRSQSTTGWSSALVAVLVALGCSSCVITEARKGAEETPVVRSMQASRSWQVVVGDAVIGSVVLFESETDSFFSVRNEWQQDVGMIDATGRAWAFRPHSSAAEWVGSGSIATGAGQILDAAGEVVLREVPLDAQ